MEKNGLPPQEKSAGAQPDNTSAGFKKVAKDTIVDALKDKHLLDSAKPPTVKPSKL